MHLRFLRTSLSLLVIAITIGLVGIGCSSSQPTQTSSDEASPSGPELAFLHVDDGTMEVHEAQVQSDQAVATGVESVGATAASPSGRYVALAYRTRSSGADSSRLAVFDTQKRTLQHLHASAQRLTYSLAWHATDDTLAFGFYRPLRDGKRGAGDVRRATPDGRVTSVGCSAAREVVDWVSDATLAARDDDTVYLVDVDGCGTQSRIDVRQKHRLAYASDGAYLAYVLQDLRYVRSEGEYVPDSTLYVSDSAGRNSTKLFGDDRKMRHLQWSPSSPELAFDLLLEDSDRRRIVIYDAEDDRTRFLVPPDKASDVDQVHPRWSESGEIVAFTRIRRTDQGVSRVAAVRLFGSTQTLGPTTGPLWGWIGNDYVVVPAPDAHRVVDTDGTEVYTLPADVTLVHAWTPRPAT